MVLWQKKPVALIINMNITSLHIITFAFASKDPDDLKQEAKIKVGMAIGSVLHQIHYFYNHYHLCHRYC